MRSAVIEKPHAAPLLTERPDLDPGPGQVLIRVRAAGLCGSDLFLQAGGFGSDQFPIVPGHEASGEVVALGAGVPRDALHSTVALYYIENSSRSRWQRSGQVNLGPGITRMGIDVDGAMSEFVLRPWSTCLRPRAPIPPVELALLTDAVATPYHALTSIARIQPGEVAVVIGVGGIGSNAVQLAAMLGARVVAIARSERSRVLADDMGAHAVVTAEQAPALVRRMTRTGADVVLQCGDGDGLSDLAVMVAGPGARIVCVAAHGRWSVPSSALIWRELQIRGSRGFTPEDVAAVQDLYLHGRIGVGHLMTDIRPLDDVARAFADMRDGQSARIVLRP